MSEMIERVARAIFEAEYADTRRPRPSIEPQWILYEKAARAAIEVMREPTDEMMVAAEDACPALTSFAKKKNSGSFIAWQAMVDEALK